MLCLMENLVRSLGLFLALGAFPASASTISGAADLIGTTYDVTIGNQGQNAGELAGMTVTALFASGPQVVCTFAIVGADSMCAGVGFNVFISPATSETHSATWVISNLRTAGAGNQLLSVEFNGIPGNTAFNPDVDDSKGGNPGHPNVNATCGQTQTKGFGNCRSAETTSGGTTLAEAQVLYFNALQLSGSSPNLDLWAGLRLTFTNNAVTFGGGQVFEFKIDTDFLGSASISTPEPSTFGMAGLALAFLAARRHLTKNS